MGFYDGKGHGEVIRLYKEVEGRGGGEASCMWSTLARSAASLCGEGYGVEAEQWIRGVLGQ